MKKKMTDAHDSDVSVRTKNFDQGGPILCDVTTNGGNVTYSGYQISGNIDNFFNYTTTTELYTTYDTLSLHDALPIWAISRSWRPNTLASRIPETDRLSWVIALIDRKSTRLNSSHRRLSRMPSSA